MSPSKLRNAAARLALAAPLALAGAAAFGGTAPVTVPSTDAGWYTEAGRHDAGNGNYLAGECCGGATDHAVQPEHRGFFVFDLTGLAGAEPIAAAALRLPTYEYHSTDPSETLALFDVTVGVKPLTKTRVSRKAFRDLGTGEVYGTHTYSPADTGGEATIVLNDAFLAAANAARGGVLMVGSALVTLDPSHATPEYVFGVESRDVAGPQLLLSIGRAGAPDPADGGGGEPVEPTDPVEPGGNTNPPPTGVPLPAAVWAGAAGLGIVGWARRRFPR